LQKAQTILVEAAIAEPTSDNLAIEMACMDIDQPIEAVGELIGLEFEDRDSDVRPRPQVGPVAT
jgi:hypothetical protein